MSSSPVIVVGTGRCGSTLLSQMLRAHPEILSISELFSFVTDLGGLIPQAFGRAPVTGAEFWAVMAGCYPRMNLLLRHGLRMAEVLYPFETGRHDPTSVPAVLLTTLPHLSDDPDALFDELGAMLSARPQATMADHYRAMFAALMRRFDRKLWVERSGGTLRIVHRLIEAFPEARFVHLVRDGRNTAISMSRHIGFRMALIGYSLLELLGVDPFDSDDRSEADDLPDDLAALLPENFSAAAFRDYDIAPSLCGHYWSGEIREGLAVLAALPAERCLTLRYEDLLENPAAVIARLGSFIGFAAPDRGWVELAAAMVGRGRSSWRELAAGDRLELTRACAPGFAALAEHGLNYEES